MLSSSNTTKAEPGPIYIRSYSLGYTYLAGKLKGNLKWTLFQRDHLFLSLQQRYNTKILPGDVLNDF